jgi:hypothetical protein
MGSSDRKMHKALDCLERTYAAEFQRHRVGLGHRRTLLDDPSTAEVTRREVLVDLATLHREAVRVTRQAADKLGGPGWLDRAGHDDDWVFEHLWASHGEPLTGLGWESLIGIATPAHR